MQIYTYARQWLSNTIGSHVLPLELILFVTERCNYRCSHCFIEEFETNPNNDLPLEKIESLSKELPHLMTLMLTGGEPFLRKDLSEIISIFSKISNPKVISVVSNGYFTDRTIETIESCLAKPHFQSQLVLTLSFEGIGDDHDAVRKKKGAFNLAIETAKAVQKITARDSRVALGANVTLLQGNEKTILNTVRELANMRLFSFLSHNIVRSGKPRDPDRSVNLSIYRELSGFINQYSSEFRMSNQDFIGKLHREKKRLQSEIIENTMRTSVYQSLPCEAGRHIGVVYADGSVAPCELLAADWGNIKNESFRSIWNRSSNRQKSSDIKKSRCFCTHECFLGASLNFQPKASLRFLVSALKRK